VLTQACSSAMRRPGLRGAAATRGGTARCEADPGERGAAWSCCWRARIRAAAGSAVAEEPGGLVPPGWRTGGAAATLEVLGQGEMYI
jgi:hypothetical protein